MNPLTRCAFVLVFFVGASSCRPGDPAIDPKTPPNSPVPTKVERPDDPKTAPSIRPDAGR